MIDLLFKIIFRDIFLRMVKYIPWTQRMCNEVVHTEPRSLAFITDHFKTQERPVEEDLHTLKFIPVHLRTHEMRKRALEKYLNPVRDVSDHFKAQEMCNKAVEEDPWWLSDFSDHLKTQGMCEKTVEDKSETLEYVPDYFKTQRMCEGAVENEPDTLNLFQIISRPNECVKGLLKKAHTT